MGKSLYDEDFVRWAEQQARAIREAGASGANLPIDWENVAEEIDSLGKSDRRELANRVATIIEHLLKLQASPAESPRRSWEETVTTQRRELRRLLKDSPSLRSDVAAAIEDELPAVRAGVLRSLLNWGEPPREDLDAVVYDAARILGDWLPEYHRPADRAATRWRSRRDSQETT